MKVCVLLLLGSRNMSRFRYICSRLRSHCGYIVCCYVPVLAIVWTARSGDSYVHVLLFRSRSRSRFHGRRSYSHSCTHSHLDRAHGAAPYVHVLLLRLRSTSHSRWQPLSPRPDSKSSWSYSLCSCIFV